MSFKAITAISVAMGVAPDFRGLLGRRRSQHSNSNCRGGHGDGDRHSRSRTDAYSHSQARAAHRSGYLAETAAA